MLTEVRDKVTKYLQETIEGEASLVLARNPITRAEKAQAVMRKAQKRHKKTPAPEPPFPVGCLLSSRSQILRFIPARVCASGYPGSWPRQSSSNWSPW